MKRRPYNTRFYNHWAWYMAWMGVGTALTVDAINEDQWFWAGILGVCTVSFIVDFFRAYAVKDVKRP